jgi:hypothetical protein
MFRAKKDQMFRRRAQRNPAIATRQNTGRWTALHTRTALHA